MIRAVVLIVAAVFAGCVLLPPADLATGRGAEYLRAVDLEKGKKYAEAAAEFRKIALLSPPAPESADALFEVARLQVFYDNPQRDYAQALTLFEEFLKRYPDHVKAQDAENWRVALKMLLDTRKENDRLNRNIEQLKRLDIRHEERRGGR